MREGEERGVGGKGRGRREGGKGPQFQKNDPPSSDGGYGPGVFIRGTANVNIVCVTMSAIRANRACEQSGAEGFAAP